jgi:hypothetical protein
MQLELLRPLWPGLRLAGRSWCAASSGRLLCGAQGDACRLRECRCPEALAEPLALGAKRRVILMRSSPGLHKRTPMLDHGRSSQIGRSQTEAPPAAARSSAG